MTKKAIIYRRVSTDKQVSEGVSLEAQLERCQQYADVQGWEVVGDFTDEGLSGKSTAGRDGLEEAIKLVKKTKGVLLIYSLSRLSRSVLDTLTLVEDLAKSKADLASVSENIDTAGPCGRFQLNVMSCMNQLEREQAAQRTRVAMNHLKSKGKRFSRFAPYGYTYANGEMKKNRKEQKVISLVKDLREQGEKQVKIVELLEEAGIKSREGTPFKQQQISKMLKNNA